MPPEVKDTTCEAKLDSIKSSTGATCPNRKQSLLCFFSSCALEAKAILFCSCPSRCLVLVRRRSAADRPRRLPLRPLRGTFAHAHYIHTYEVQHASTRPSG